VQLHFLVLVSGGIQYCCGSSSISTTLQSFWHCCYYRDSD